MSLPKYIYSGKIFCREDILHWDLTISLSRSALLKNFLISLVLAALGLCCCTWAFSRCSEQGLLSDSSALASHRSGFSYRRARSLGHEGFSSCNPWAQ